MQPYDRSCLILHLFHKPKPILHHKAKQEDSPRVKQEDKTTLVQRDQDQPQDQPQEEQALEEVEEELQPLLPRPETKVEEEEENHPTSLSQRLVEERLPLLLQEERQCADR